MITQSKLKELVDYDAPTGIFRWKKSRYSNLIGKPAGARKEGYVILRLEGARYRAHRIAWLYVYGMFPAMELDHIDRVKSNNAISNLRMVTRHENMNNVVWKNCKNEVRGTSRMHNGWCARISINGKRRFLGIFKNPEESGQAYQLAKVRLLS